MVSDMPETNAPLEARIDQALRIVPDFPKPGIQFRDIAPLLADPALFEETIAAMVAPFKGTGVTHVVGIESRGFLFGVPIAQALGVAFVPARKPGKLPGSTMRESFALEYGSDSLEMHTDAVNANSRVLIVDDILATGGTVAAACRLVERMGAHVEAICVLGEIRGVLDPARLAGRHIHVVVGL